MARFIKPSHPIRQPRLTWNAITNLNTFSVIYVMTCTKTNVPRERAWSERRGIRGCVGLCSSVLITHYDWNEILHEWETPFINGTEPYYFFFYMPGELFTLNRSHSKYQTSLVKLHRLCYWDIYLHANVHKYHVQCKQGSWDYFIPIQTPWHTEHFNRCETC